MTELALSPTRTAASTRTNTTSPSAALASSAERLLARVGHWSAQRWRAKPRPGVGARAAPVATRADVMHELVQQLADAGARAEGRAARPVPRLTNELCLPDQLRVMVVDLLAAPPESADKIRVSCATLIDATARLL